MSPAYADIEDNDESKLGHYREMYPSINDISSVSHSIIQNSHMGDDQNADGMHQVNTVNVNADIEEAHANALLTESDNEDENDLEGHPTNRVGAAIMGDELNASRVAVGMGDNTRLQNSQLINNKPVNVAPTIIDDKKMGLGSVKKA